MKSKGIASSDDMRVEYDSTTQRPCAASSIGGF
jgi:hypothetical protein